MRKGFTLTTILLSVFLFATVALAELTESQKQIVNDFYETYAFNPRSYNDVCAEVASRHGITVDALNRIKTEALNQEPTDEEWEVYDDIIERVKNLPGGPEGSSNEDRKRVSQEVAAKYGLTQGELFLIETRCIEWDIF